MTAWAVTKGKVELPSASRAAWLRLHMARAEYESAASTLRLFTRCGFAGTQDAALVREARKAAARADMRLTAALEEVEALP